MHVFHFSLLSLYHLSCTRPKYLFLFIFLPNWNSWPSLPTFLSTRPFTLWGWCCCRTIGISVHFSLFSAPSLSMFNPSINVYVPISVFHCSSYFCPLSFSLPLIVCLSCLTGHQIRAFHNINDKNTGGGFYSIQKQWSVKAHWMRCKTSTLQGPPGRTWNRQFDAPLTDTFSQFLLRGNMHKVVRLSKKHYSQKMLYVALRKLFPRLLSTWILMGL